MTHHHTSNNSRKKILLTGARAPHTLHLARLLQQKGHSIITAETSPFHISYYSNAVEKNYIVPSPRFHYKEFTEKLIDIVNQEKVEFIIPSWEEILYISRIKNQFPKDSQVFCSDFDLLHQLHHKWNFYNLVRSHNFLSPNTFAVNSQEDVYRLRLRRPFALKSSYSRAGQSVFKVDMNQRLPNIEFTPNNQWIAQSWIDGEKYCSYSICHEGRVTAHAAYPVRYAIDEKSCITFEAIDHPGILEWVKAFAKAISFTGQIAFDFIDVPKKGIHVIECNPRSTSGLYLFTSPDDLHRALFEPSEEILRPTIPTQKQIATGMLMYGWRNYNNGNKMKPNGQSFYQTLKSFEDVVFNTKDLMPFISQSWLYVYYIWKSHQLKLSIPAFFTHDLDWNGEV